jgi:hypothetical protein
VMSPQNILPPPPPPATLIAESGAPRTQPRPNA